MSPVEQRRAQERRQVVWGQGHSQESSLHWIKSQKHFSISLQFYLTYHPNPNLRRGEELRTKALDLDCRALNPAWLLLHCASLSKLINFSVIPFPHPENGDILFPCFIRLL